MSTLRRYLKIYLQLMSFSLKHMMEYRWNTFVQSFYAPAYMAAFYLTLQVIFLKTPTLGGWQKEEAILFFSVAQILYTSFLLLFMKSFRWLMTTAISHGELDFLLTKPVHIRVFVGLSRPDMDMLLNFALMMALFFRQLFLFHSQLEFWNVLLFSVLMLIGFLIGYLTISTYATLAFFVSRSRQVIEFFDKASDFSQYPTNIFPESVQVMAVTLVPIAFFSYIPTLFLLGKGTAELFILTVVALLILYLVNTWAWKKGLAAYTSASS